MRRLLLCSFLAVLLVACSSGDSGGDQQASTERPPTSAVPGCRPAPLETRAGRVLIVGILPVTSGEHGLVGEVLEIGVGGVLLTPPNVVSVEQVKALVDDVRRQAARPLLVVTGEESGRVSAFRKVFGATPTARELGGRTPPEVQAFAQDLGAKLKSVGVDLALAPVADLDDGPARGIIGDRSFSADPTVAGDFAMAWARGLNAAGVHPTAKHFPGHGRIREDSHSALTRLDTPLAELEATDVRPFARLIDAGVPAVLLDHVAYAAFDPDLPASLSPKAYTFLRKLGFQGVAITDSVGMGAVNLQWPFAEAAVLSIVAGADAVLATDGAQARPMRDAIVAAVRDGRLPESRLNQAAARMEALAGGDSRALACVAVEVPKLSP